jgi:hypothetical protein
MEAAAQASRGKAPLDELLASYRVNQVEALIQTRAYADALQALKSLPAKLPAAWPATNHVQWAALVAAGMAVASLDDKLTAEAKEQWAQTFGDEAMALVREAVRRGFKDAPALEKNEELKALRERQDFKDLLAKLKGAMGEK